MKDGIMVTYSFQDIDSINGFSLYGVFGVEPPSCPIGSILYSILSYSCDKITTCETMYVSSICSAMRDASKYLLNDEIILMGSTRTISNEVVADTVKVEYSEGLLICVSDSMPVFV